MRGLLQRRCWPLDVQKANERERLESLAFIPFSPGTCPNLFTKPLINGSENVLRWYQYFLYVYICLDSLIRLELSNCDQEKFPRYVLNLLKLLHYFSLKVRFEWEACCRGGLESVDPLTCKRQMRGRDWSLLLLYLSHLELVQTCSPNLSSLVVRMYWDDTNIFIPRGQRDHNQLLCSVK